MFPSIGIWQPSARLGASSTRWWRTSGNASGRGEISRRSWKIRVWKACGTKGGSRSCGRNVIENEQALIDKASAGDKAAFDVLAKEYIPRLERFAVLMG